MGIQQLDRPRTYCLQLTVKRTYTVYDEHSELFFQLVYRVFHVDLPINAMVSKQEDNHRVMFFIF